MVFLPAVTVLGSTVAICISTSIEIENGGLTKCLKVFMHMIGIWGKRRSYKRKITLAC